LAPKKWKSNIESAKRHTKKTTASNKKRKQKNTYQKYIPAFKKLENTCPTEGPEKEMKKNKLVAQCLFGGKC